MFVVENEITGLPFPPMPDSMVVLGLGHAVSLIAGSRWLSERDVHYWSDLDTHGFAMLDRLRASLPRVRSLLMDRATLLTHRPLWTAEEAPHVAPLDRLTPEEAAAESLGFQPWTWFDKNTTIAPATLNRAAGKKRKTKRVRSSPDDGVAKYSVLDALRHYRTKFKPETLDGLKKNSV